MKFDYALLKSRLKVKGINVIQLAKMIGMGAQNLYKKLDNRGYFTQKEILAIKEVLQIDNIMDYFFCEECL